MAGMGSMALLLLFCIVHRTWGLFVLVLLVVGVVAWQRRSPIR
jgi:hypothetical protein